MELKKMELTSASGHDINLEALYQIMPSAFTEVRDEKTGEISHKINFDTLRELLGDNAYEGADEEYGFKWVGKNAARREAARPINKTLRPCPEESVNWENTQNLYIEGDNLEVLKLLQKSYLGKIKMIYIDPPYNTGNDFVYRDDFAMKADGYDLEAGNVDELGNRFRKSTDSDGRFHSDWCSMIYERLLIAKTLLADEGVIFISIDDNEVRNLRNICDEVFSENNFVAQMIWEQGRKSMAAQVAVNHEYCLIYCKNKSRFIEFDKLHENTNWREKKLGLEAIYAEFDRLKSLYGNNYSRIEKEIRAFYKQLPEDNPSKRQSQYKCVDKKGLYFPGDIAQGTGTGGRFDIIHPVTNRPCKLPKGGWRFGIEKLPQLLEEDRIHFGIDETKVPCLKRYLRETEYEVVSSVFYKDGRGASKRLETLFDNVVFDFPKDEDIIKKFITLATSYSSNFQDCIILDFFSGSATTAHAVMKLNAEDGGNRRYIMVQLPEKTDENSEAYKAGYENICEIGKERIRRAGKKIKEEAGLEAQNLDTGFRVFKCDDSNMQDVYFTPSDYSQDLLSGLIDNVKDERNDLDLLFGCMLDWGVQLSLPLSNIEVNGKKIHIVNDGDLVACFEKDIDEEIISAIAEQLPLRVVFRDSCFSDAPLKMNLFEIFKQKCGWSEDIVKNRVHVI